MTGSAKNFNGITPFAKRIWLSSPTMHGDELRFVSKAVEDNWVTTLGENINEFEKFCTDMIGRKYAVGLSSGTSALHLAIKLCGEKLYGRPKVGEGALMGRKAFCSDMTFNATVNPVAYEGGEPVFIDTDPETWNMDPEALEKAFRLYPDVRLVVIANLYGYTGDLEKLVDIAHRHGALVVEDAAESFGATFNGRQTASFGDIGVISLNGNKIVTGSSGGVLLTDDREDANIIRKWSTQSREAAAWYQHEELGYNYRMSNIIAGIARGNVMHLNEHIRQKKEIFERYREGFKDLPLTMNPIICGCVPNYWLSCALIDPAYMCRQTRGELAASYVSEPGKTCPTEILEALNSFNAEGRPIWKPMHMQPIYCDNQFVMRDDFDCSADIFERGLCLPSDNKMNAEQQEKIIEIVRRCFM